jgi:predicted nucleic acid-binding protein
MRRIVVDTNVAFSTFLNINSRIGQILLNGAKYYDFFAPEYIRYELIGHKERIKNIGKLSDYLRGKLWTGDIRLINGLITKGYSRIVTTNELYTDFLQKENKK